MPQRLSLPKSWIDSYRTTGVFLRVLTVKVVTLETTGVAAAIPGRASPNARGPSLPACNKKREGSRQESAGTEQPLGKCFHIFAVMAILAMIPCPCKAKVQPGALQPDADLRSPILDTVWDPQKLAAFPDLLHAESLTADMQAQFQNLQAPHSTWREVKRRLSFCDLAFVQLRFVYASILGAERCVPRAGPNTPGS